MQVLNRTTAQKKVLDIKDLFVLFLPQFSNRRVQYDAHEFMIYLREILTEEVKHLQDIQQPRTYFTGILKKVKICMDCKFEAPEIHEEFNDLSIPVTKSTFTTQLHLQDLLTDFLKDDIVQMYCPNCAPLRNVDFSLRTSISSPPRILTIVLKRCLPDFSKLKQEVVCSNRLDLSLEESNMTASYEHKSTISHIGSHSNSGHYIAYKRFSQGRCFQLNDAIVTEMTSNTTSFEKFALNGNEAAEETPHILIYDLVQNTSLA